MARRRRQAATSPPRASWHAVPVEARRLITVGPDDEAWSSRYAHSVLTTVEWKGAIVRLRPPPGCSDERVEAVRQLLIGVCVAAVRVEARHGAVVPLEAGAEFSEIKTCTVREAVQSLVESANVEDREALRAYVWELIEEEGL